MYEFQVRVLRGWLGEVDAFPKVRRKLDTASEQLNNTTREYFFAISYRFHSTIYTHYYIV